MSPQNINKAKASTKEHLYDVFLCHNSSDKDMVEMIAQRLEDEASLRPFLDKWHLVPGEPWQEDLETALDASTTCAVFVGANGLSPWENEEMRAALNERVVSKSLRVIPVLLPGTHTARKRALPRFLQRYTWVDFREGVQSADAFQRLVAGITGKPPGRTRANTGNISTGEQELVKWMIVLKGTVDEVDNALIEAITTQLREISGDASLTIRKIKQGSIILIIESSKLAFEKVESQVRQGILNYIEGMDVVRVERDNDEHQDDAATQDQQNESNHDMVLSNENKTLWDEIFQELVRFGGVDRDELDRMDSRDLAVIFQESQTQYEEAESTLRSPRIMGGWPSKVVRQLVKWAHRHKSVRDGGRVTSYLAEHILRSYEISLKLHTKKEGSEEDSETEGSIS